MTHAYENAAAFRKHWSAELRDAGGGLIDGLSLTDARKVLDLGAGIGVNLPTIRQAAPAAFVVGADLVESMIAAAPPEFARVVMDAAMVGFADGSFDAVVMAFMLFHVPVPAEALAEVHRILRQDGRLGLGTWDARSEDMPADMIWNDLLDELGAAPAVASARNHEIMATSETITTLLEDSGFRDVKTGTKTFEDTTDLDDFLERRTQLGISRTRFDSLDAEAREQCLALARDRLGRLDPHDFLGRETSLYAWARRP
jgi:ubiquinone/menaquinone biosynthesis C-methylase UbiE